MANNKFNTVSIPVEEYEVGIILGTQYSTIKSMKEKYCVEIKFKKPNEHYNRHCFMVSSKGNENNILECVQHIQKLGLKARKIYNNPKNDIKFIEKNLKIGNYYNESVDLSSLNKFNKDYYKRKTSNTYNYERTITKNNTG